MREELIKQLTPIIVSFIISVFTVVMTTVGVVVRKYFKLKAEEVLNMIAKSKHEAQFRTAMQVWAIVDEHFRVSKSIGDTIQLKINMFDDLLLKKIPSLQKADIDFLRQSVAGEVNRYKELFDAGKKEEA